MISLIYDYIFELGMNKNGSIALTYNYCYYKKLYVSLLNINKYFVLDACIMCTNVNAKINNHTLIIGYRNNQSYAILKHVIFFP